MKRKIGFIGAGNMGSAIMRGIEFSELKWEIEIYVFDPDDKKIDDLSDCNIIKCQSIIELTKECDIVFLAIKPQMFNDVLNSIKDYVTSNMIFVSIAAGIPAESIRKSLGSENIKVVITMPNTPLLLGEGATAIAETDDLDKKQFEFVCKVFESCGKIQVISKDKMKEIIAINGSSPAFIYLFAKGFIENAVKNGIDADAAKILFSQTLTGSAKMITESGYTIDELIKMVSSPGGTTLAGLDKFYEHDLVKIVNEACDACTNRAYELAK